MNARIDHAVTSGTFSLDGGTWDVDNNVWVIGDDSECIVLDAPHDAAAIAAIAIEGNGILIEAAAVVVARGTDATLRDSGHANLRWAQGIDIRSRPCA